MTGLSIVYFQAAGVNFFLLTVLSITLFFILCQVSFYLVTQSRVRSVLESLPVLPAIAFGFLLAETLRVMSGFSYETVFPASVLASKWQWCMKFHIVATTDRICTDV